MIDTLITRTQQIRDAAPRLNAKQRVADAAQSISRAGDNQARVELLNEALLALTVKLYETDETGRLVNVDSRTYRLLIPAPWGKAGWKRWGLRDWEATVLRRVLILRSEGRVAPVLDYAADCRQWYLNRAAYPTPAAALAYWRANPVALRDWHLFADRYRQAAHARMRRRRTSGSL